MPSDPPEERAPTLRRILRVARRATPTPDLAQAHTANGSPCLEAAQSLGWELTAAVTSFLSELDRRLEGAATPKVAVLVEDGDTAVPDLLRSALPGATVVTCEVEANPRSTQVLLATVGRFDLIVDDTGIGPHRGDQLSHLFFHLRKGGALVCRRPRRGAKVARLAHDPGSIATLLGGLAAATYSDARSASSRARGDLRAMARLAHIEMGPRHLILVNRGVAYAKIRDEEMNTLLTTTARPRGEVLATLAPTTFVSRCVVRQGPTERPVEYRDSFEVPELSLRRYDKAVCAPGQVVMQHNVLLPDTYRHNHRERLANRFTQELGPGFARLKDRSQPTRPLEGAYFYLDSEFRGHYGHLLTEQMSRLWAYQRAQETEPGVKGLLLTNRRPELLPYEALMFEAAGISPEDLYFAHQPRRVERLYAASPMFVNPAFIHPDLVDVWRRVGDYLADLAPAAERPRRFFCARRNTKRACLNAPEVERFFAARGFTILYPEDYTIPEQVMLFRDAEVVAGWAGTALFSLLFCLEPKRLLMVSSESYTAKNEYLIASALGHTLDVAWCRPALSQTKGNWSHKALQSPFSFDFEREGAWLDDIIAAL